MLKKIVLAVALALPMIASAQTVKIGIVDTNAVIASLPETTAAQSELEQRQKGYEEEYKKLGEEMNRRLDEFKKLDDKTLPAIRENKARDLQDYQQKIEEFERSASTDLQKLQNDLMAPILQKVRQAIESVGKEGNYTLITDRNPQVILYFAAPAVDITNDVKAKLGVK